MGCGNSIDVKPVSRFKARDSLTYNKLMASTQIVSKDSNTLHYNPEQLKYILTKKAPRPLINLGNTCYINSRKFFSKAKNLVIQALILTKNFLLSLVSQERINFPRENTLTQEFLEFLQ